MAVGFHRMRGPLVAGAWLAFAAGCGADASHPTTWESVETVFSDDEIVVEKVTYESDGWLVYGQVCRPSAAGQYPVVVVNHGGFEGLGAELGPQSGCRTSARDGYVVIESSYRGEDGSEGAVEVCLGEVDDVLTMLDITLAQPYADPARVGIMGGSHGGCITLRMMQRGAPAVVGVAFAPGQVVLDEVPHGFLPDHVPSAAAFGDFLGAIIAKLPAGPAN